MKYLSALYISFGLLSSLTAKEVTAPPAPAQLCSQLKQALPAAERGSVSFSGLGGNAAAVVISPEGYVLTAGHVGEMMQDKENVKVVYLDGTEATVKMLGWNVETDTALMKITSPERKDWPHAKLAKTATTTGGFCFTTSSKFGFKQNRKPIVRMGRVVSHSTLRDKPGILISDMNIQPGDSGGGLFNLKGELIGINSSAAGPVGMNIYPSIDQFYLDQERLKKGERWGNKDIAPTKAENYTLSATEEVLAAVQQELSRRLQLNYPPTIEFIREHLNENNEVSLTPQQLIHHMIRDALMIGKKQPISLGMDDPALTKQLQKLPEEHTKAITIFAGEDAVANGMAIDKKHLITKLSMVNEKDELKVTFAKVDISAKVAAKDPSRDLALLELSEEAPFPAIKWPETNKKPSVGDLIVATNAKGWKLWGNLSNTTRAIKKKASLGPLDDESLISKHRAPYPATYICAIPLFAQDAGVPVFDKDNNLLGIYIARYTRTMGLILPASELKTSVDKMLEKLE